MGVFFKFFFALEDIGFQLQQRQAMSPRRRLGTIPNLPIPQSHFHVLANPSVHPNTWFSKAIRQNSSASLLEHRNKWESALHGIMGGCNSHPYLEYGSIVTIVSKEEKTYLVSTANLCHAVTLQRCHQ